MIRFKVIHASRLIWGLVIALLVVILAVMVVRLVLLDDSTPTSINFTNTNIVLADEQEETEAVAAFAAAVSSLGGSGALFSDFEEEPEVPEPDEHAPSGMIIEKIPYEAAASSLPMPAATAEPERAASGTADAVKRVLIYHTHTHEAYQQDEDDPYVELEQWRTDDGRHSVVRVGAELAELLAGYGYEVVHDKTDHEPPYLGTAYVRSLETLMKYEGQPFDCYIDLHRDEYIEGSLNTLKLSANAQCAHLMMLIGNGVGFDEKPFYTENLSFARQLTLALNYETPGICKEVLVKDGRYNQHVGKNAVVVEVGNNMNTLKEALAAMPTLAKALDEVLSGQVFLDDTNSKPAGTQAVPASAGS